MNIVAGFDVIWFDDLIPKKKYEWITCQIIVRFFTNLKVRDHISADVYGKSISYKYFSPAEKSKCKYYPFKLLLMLHSKLNVW